MTMQDQDPEEQPPSDSLPVRRDYRRVGQRLLSVFTTLMASGVALGLVTFGTIVIHERAGARADASATPPVAVETVQLQLETTVRQKVRFVGEVEPARSNQLAFERPGTVSGIAVDEGDRIEAGAILATLDTRLLDARKSELQARKAGLEAQVELAELTLRRQTVLRDRGHTSGQTFDEVRLQLVQLRAGLLEIDAALQAVTVDLAKSRILAPFAGQVTARLLDEGSVVAPGTAILSLIEAGRPQLRVGVPAAMAGELAAGQSVVVEHQGASVKAQVAAVRPDIDPVTRSQIVLVDLPSQSSFVFGMTAELIIESERSTEGYWVPLTALREGSRGLWNLTTVVERDLGLEAAAETVEIVLVEADRAFVRGTLTGSPRIVASGTHRLVPGATVTLQDAD
ncbi:MAG: efflux RND transporter periplasmic adaptor subunit [Pseudomonadota bacterium]